MNRLDRKCSAPECSQPVWARELCRKHYMRWHTHGDATKALVKHPQRGSLDAFLDSIPASGTGCLIWPFCKNNNGYAQININGKKFLVSRLICARAHGPAPTNDHVAAHECDNGHSGCIAPWHLIWKTSQQNRDDALSRGRLSRGERHSLKLISQQVAEILSLSGMMSQRKIGEKFGISQSAVSLIVTGKNWKNFPNSLQGKAPTCEPATKPAADPHSVAGNQLERT